jgi:DNA-binding transcriptional ArsR family regulator
MSYASDVLRSGGDADCTGPAELIGHPARSAMLLALLDGRALPMSMLASEAGVAASTARAHLSRLVDGGLLEVSRQGRHRYYAIASPDVARTLAALADRTGPRPARSMRAGTRASTLRVARRRRLQAVPAASTTKRPPRLLVPHAVPPAPREKAHPAPGRQ